MIRIPSKLLIVILLVTLIPVPFILAQDSTPFAQLFKAPEEKFTRFQEPNYLSFEELKQLSENPSAVGLLKQKLDKFWVTPIISNEAYYKGVKPHRPTSPQLGDYMRVMSWNIEKSLNMDKAIRLFQANETQFLLMVNPEEAAPGSEEFENIKRQWSRIQNVDVILLQEMEIGIKRSQYWNAAAKLAETLDMNYAYAAQYLEVDPVILGLETLEMEDGSPDTEAMDYYSVDPAQYKGVFGSAVLSRYPIKNVQVFPLKTKPYDWYHDEIQKIGFLEKSRRLGTKTLFKNELTRELKVGNRNFFRVDLEVPELPNQTLTIINIHLEIKCQPEDRERQIAEILSYIKGIDNPVIMMGDFNAAPTDISPTSVARVTKRTLKNPSTWFGLAVNYATPHGMAINTTRGVAKVTKNFNDPFAADVKVVAPNPLKSMFARIRDYRFSDKGAFDFRGDKERSIGEKDGILANSNQRGTKGFVTSFSVKRALGIVGKYRLDWVFVKSYLTSSEDTEGSYKFAPHFGETLEELNTSLKDQISDHHPSLIDLPFEEPLL